MTGFTPSAGYHPDSASSSAPFGARTATIAFTGSGSEYFRIWIVNLLLTLVTVGIYFPFAKVRRLRYFYGNTVVDGHPMAFHGKPMAMLRGYALMTLLFMLYAGVSNLSPWAGIAVVVLLVGVWPRLFRASMQFRMANTSWRGIRFRFLGDVKDAYVAFAPLMVLSAVFLIGGLFQQTDESNTAPVWLQLVLGLGSTVASLAFPYGMWKVKQYQHTGYEYAGERSRFIPGAGSYYRIGFEAGALAIGCFVVAGILVAVVAGMGMAVLANKLQTGAPLAIAMVVLAYVSFITIMQTFYAARMQNLIWNGTYTPLVQCQSELKFRQLFAVNLKNWALVVCTLGLYWPFAAVAAARLRLEAVHLQISPAFDAVVATPPSAMDNAVGEAAGDLFGIDFGL